MRIKLGLFGAIALLAVPIAASAMPVTITAADVGAAFSFTLPAGGLFEAITDPNDVDTQLFLFTEDAEGNWIGIWSDDDNPGPPQLASSYLTWDTTGSSYTGPYHLLVTMFNANPLDSAGNEIFIDGA